MNDNLPDGAIVQEWTGSLTKTWQEQQQQTYIDAYTLTQVFCCPEMVSEFLERYNEVQRWSI